MCLLKEQLSLLGEGNKFKRLAKRFLSSRCGEWLRKIVTIRNLKLLKKLPPLLLKPSELFIYVLQSPPINRRCTALENVCDIHADFINGCCGVRVPFGRTSGQKSLEQVYNSPLARIIKLSSLNGSFCLCNLRKCQDADFTAGKLAPTDRYLTSPFPRYVSISTDRSCNLKCGSCRESFYAADAATTQQIMGLHQRLLASGWLEKAETVTMCTMGEIFYSPAYRQLLVDLAQRRQQISIQSNGTLINAQNLTWLVNKYREVNFSISIDAATAATYQKLRGGDFQQLLRNLTMLGDLRLEGKILWLQFCFVVQNDNWREMLDFVALAKKLHVDRIRFVPLENWHTYSAREWRRRNIIKHNRYLSPDLYYYLQNPIFVEPIVDLRSFAPYLANSAKRYGK